MCLDFLEHDIALTKGAPKVEPEVGVKPSNIDSNTLLDTPCAFEGPSGVGADFNGVRVSTQHCNKRR